MSDTAGRALIRTALASGDFSFLSLDDARTLAKKLNDWIQVNSDGQSAGMEEDVLLLGDLRAELKENLDRLMFHYQYNQNGPDFSCVFCYEEGQHSINHRKICLGNQLKKVL